MALSGNLHEHILNAGEVNAQAAHQLSPALQLPQQGWEGSAGAGAGAGGGQPELDLPASLADEGCSWHVALHQGQQGGHCSSWGWQGSAAHYGQRVAQAIGVLEELGAAAALHAASSHDADAVRQDVSLIHKVRGEQDDAPLAGILQDLPGGAPAVGVHATSWFIQEHHLGSTQEGNAHAQLALLPARHAASSSACLLSEAHLHQGL